MSVTEKTLRQRVILIVGDEDILRREALAEVFRVGGIQPDDFDLETFAGDDTKPLDWIASVGTAPFLAERRTAVVRHLLRGDIADLKPLKLEKLLPQSGLLILVGDDVTGNEDRQKRATTLRKAWETAVTKAGGAVVKCDSDPQATRNIVNQRANAIGKPMSEKALDALIEMTGGGLSRALDELEKVTLYVGAAEQIRESDVRRVVAPSREWNVFKMVDAIVGGDVAEAMRQLQTLVGSAARAEEAAFSRILPLVSRQLRFLWQARLCVDASCSPSRAPETIRAMFPDRPNLASESPYRQGAVMALARRMPIDRLDRCFTILADTDARLKGALDAFSGIETLERMVLEMAAA